MKPDSFRDFHVFRKEKFGLVFSSRDGGQIGFLTFVVQNAFQKWSCCGEHLGELGPVISLEQRIQQGVDLFCVHVGCALHRVRPEVTVHGAAEEDGQFAKDFGVVLEIRVRKAKKIVQVARVAAVNHGFNFPAKHFLRCQNRELTRLRVEEGRSRERAWRERKGTHQKIDLHLKSVLRSGVVEVAEIPFAQGVIIDAVLKFVAEAGSDLFHGLDDVRAFGEHRLAINVADVVQIDVHRKPLQTQVEQVEGRAALESEFPTQEGMPLKLVQEFPKTKDLLEVVGLKADCFRRCCETRAVEFHVGMLEFPVGASVSGTMSLQVGTQRFPGRLVPRYATPGGSLRRKRSRASPRKKSLSAWRSSRKPNREYSHGLRRSFRYLSTASKSNDGNIASDLSSSSTPPL